MPDSVATSVANFANSNAGVSIIFIGAALAIPIALVAMWRWVMGWYHAWRRRKAIAELGEIVYGVAALTVNDGMPALPAEMLAEAVSMLDRSIWLVERYIGVAAGLRLRTAADLPPTGRITSAMAIALLNVHDARPEKGSLLQRVWHAKGMLEQLLSEVRD